VDEFGRSQIIVGELTVAAKDPPFAETMWVMGLWENRQQQSNRRSLREDKHSDGQKQRYSGSNDKAKAKVADF
jgi:hypothetical protein